MGYQNRDAPLAGVSHSKPEIDPEIEKSHHKRDYKEATLQREDTQKKPRCNPPLSSTTSRRANL